MDAFTATADGNWILAVSKDRLKDAPGFDKSDWPDMANPQFGSRVREFYGRPGSRSGRSDSNRDRSDTNRPRR